MASGSAPEASCELESAGTGRRVTGALMAATHQLQLRLDHELRPVGLSARGFVALCAIQDNPGLSRAQMAKELGVAAQAVGSMAARLVAAGLAESSSLGPGNPTSYRLTPRGLDRLDLARERVAQLERQLSGRLHDTTLERIVRDTTQVLEALR